MELILTGKSTRASSEFRQCLNSLNQIKSTPTRKLQLCVRAFLVSPCIPACRVMTGKNVAWFDLSYFLASCWTFKHLKVEKTSRFKVHFTGWKPCVCTYYKMENHERQIPFPKCVEPLVRPIKHSVYVAVNISCRGQWCSINTAAHQSPQWQNQLRCSFDLFCPPMVLCPWITYCSYSWMLNPTHFEVV